MANKGDVPDAWDDDWEPQADQTNPGAEDSSPPGLEQPLPPKTKAERLAQHAEANRTLWQTAETPDTFHFLEANNNVPLASTFKPQVKVLSRRPVIAKRDPAGGMAQMSLEDEAGEEGKKEAQPSLEEIRARQKREREEKQRRYDEARAKIFGEAGPASGTSSPGTITPPRSDGQRTPRGRGRGRGGLNTQRTSDRNNGEIDQFESRRIVPPGSSRELYDPNFSPKPEASAQGRSPDTGPPSRNSTPRNEQPAIRAPRGPDGSGRGGFGFARRGGKES